MSVLSGKVVCDRCGGDCGNGAVTECAVATVMGDDGQLVTMHFCYRSDDKHERCATRVFTAKAVAARADRVKEPLTIRRIPD